MRFCSELLLLLFNFFRGRLLHGCHFTFKHSTGDVAVTFVSEGVDGSFACKEHPFVAKGLWLHVYLDPALVATMVKDVECLEKAEKVQHSFCTYIHTYVHANILYAFVYTLLYLHVY